MKIRIDYVSNSSSSSFMIVGAIFTYNELVEMAKHNNLTTEKDYEELDIWDLIERLEEKFPDLSFNHGLENFGDDVCIGMEYSSMKDDEMKKDFEKRIKEKLKELTGKDEKVECLIDSGRDS